MTGKQRYSREQSTGMTEDTKHDSINLLIVDDDKGVLWTLRELLQVYDFRVDTATSGDAALAALSKTDFNCILMDIVMPEQSGVEVFRKIKLLKPETPVIFMTGYAHYNLEAEARREGAVDVIPKPIDMKYLVALIENIAATSRIDVNPQVDVSSWIDVNLWVDCDKAEAASINS